MAPCTPTDVLRQLQWRYAVKRFDQGRTIPAETWSVLEQALVLAPSSFGLQPWKFVVAVSPALRLQLRAASWNQAQVTDASHYVVFAGLRTVSLDDVDRSLSRVAEVRGVEVASFAGYRKVIATFVASGWAAKDLGAWNARQGYLALGQFMTAAAMLGVDTCPMEGIDLAAYDRLLALDGTPYTTLCACAAGYRAGDDKYSLLPKVRYPTEQLVEHR